MPIGAFKLNSISAALQAAAPSQLVATGGEVYAQIVGGTKYQFHRFATPGNNTFSVTNAGSGKVDLLLVGGGGSGGGNVTFRVGGGGGGGQVRNLSNVSVTAQNYTISIAATQTTSSTAGNSSSALGYTANGGGAGGANAGGAGSSSGGGGGGANTSGIAAYAGGTGTLAGGNGVIISYNYRGAGGGGGSNQAAGSNATVSSDYTVGGNGAAGVSVTNFQSSTLVLAAGGGGGTSYLGIAGNGGSSIGGGGGGYNANGSNAVAATGSGGGGCGEGGGALKQGGSGASGIAYIRYPFTSTRTAKSVVRLNNTVVNTNRAKFGTASASFVSGTADRLRIANPDDATEGKYTDFGFGTGDYTIELWAYLTTRTVNTILFDLRVSGGATAQARPYVHANTDGTIRFFINDAANAKISGGSFSLNTWNHVALCRASGVTRLFLNGSQAGSNYTDTISYLAAPMMVGGGYTIGGTGNTVNGNIDEIRISNFARYTAAFTQPTAAFVDDVYTKLLIHADGTNGSTTFTDDNT